MFRLAKKVPDLLFYGITAATGTGVVINRAKHIHPTHLPHRFFEHSKSVSGVAMYHTLRTEGHPIRAEEHKMSPGTPASAPPTSTPISYTAGDIERSFEAGFFADADVSRARASTASDGPSPASHAPTRAVFSRR